jgi:hypothetical protein
MTAKECGTIDKTKGPTRLKRMRETHCESLESGIQQSRAVEPESGDINEAAAVVLNGLCDRNHRDKCPG